MLLTIFCLFQTKWTWQLYWIKQSFIITCLIFMALEVRYSRVSLYTDHVYLDYIKIIFLSVPSHVILNYQCIEILKYSFSWHGKRKIQFNMANTHIMSHICVSPWPYKFPTILCWKSTVRWALSNPRSVFK